MDQGYSEINEMEVESDYDTDDTIEGDSYTSDASHANQTLEYYNSGDFIQTPKQHISDLLTEPEFNRMPGYASRCEYNDGSISRDPKSTQGISDFTCEGIALPENNSLLDRLQYDATNETTGSATVKGRLSSRQSHNFPSRTEFPSVNSYDVISDSTLHVYSGHKQFKNHGINAMDGSAALTYSSFTESGESALCTEQESHGDFRRPIQPPMNRTHADNMESHKDESDDTDNDDFKTVISLDDSANSETLGLALVESNIHVISSDSPSDTDFHADFQTAQPRSSGDNILGVKSINYGTSDIMDIVGKIDGGNMEMATIDVKEVDSADLSGFLQEENDAEFSESISEEGTGVFGGHIEELNETNLTELTEEALGETTFMKVDELDVSYDEHVEKFLESIPENASVADAVSESISADGGYEVLETVSNLVNDVNVPQICLSSEGDGLLDLNPSADVGPIDGEQGGEKRGDTGSKSSGKLSKKARLDLGKRLKKKRLLMKRRSDATGSSSEEPKKKIRRKRAKDGEGSAEKTKDGEKKIKRKKKKTSDEAKDADGETKKKTNKDRRNIRKIIKEEDLDTETRNAQIEEMERRKRLMEKMKLVVPQPQQLTSRDDETMVVVKKEPKEEPEQAPSQLKTLLEEAEEEAAKFEKDEDSDDVIMVDDGKAGVKEDDDEKDQDVIELSSDEDDIIIDKEDDDDDVGELEDMNDSGYHINDLDNLLDHLGRVLVNTKHPEEDPDIFLSPHIARVVKPHQIGGIRFMYDNIVESLTRQKTSNGFGCILAHSMGLGKTIQVIGFTDIYLRCTTAKTVLCIVPINTLQNWMAEFNMWLPPMEINGLPQRSFRVFLLNDSFRTMAARAQVINEWYKEGGVLLIGYEMYRLVAARKAPLLYGKPKRNVKKAAEPEVIDIDEEDKTKVLLEDIHAALINPGPDLVICDEGHRIKNHLAGISKALKNIKTRRRLVLTGYPLQNNLMEYWCMVDFVRPNYLGTKSEFSNMFERPIMNGQCQDSQIKDRRLMRFRAHVLHSLLGGFVQRRSHIVLKNSLPRKQEFVFKIRMSPIQTELYKRFMQIMDDLAKSSGAINTLKAFAVCCKIWNHPDVINKVIVRNRAGLLDDDLDLDTEGSNPGTGAKKKTSRSAAGSPAVSSSPGGSSTPSATPTPTPTIFGDGDRGAGIDYDWAQDILMNYDSGKLENGTKMDLLFELISESLRLGDKMLVFSQSLFTLNIIEEYLSRTKVPRPDMDENWCRNKSYFRLDGSTQGMERERLINQFNDPQQTKVWLFLLSTRAGSLGINLVGASRVVVMDASWNPCHDCQAICRVFRYGQTRQTYVYRLITDNTLERKIYDRQISKQGMADRVIDELNPQNNFKRSQLDKLLEYEEAEFPEVDFTDVENKIDDEVVVRVLQKKGNLLTSFPFTHESLLIDNKELRLTKQEKRMAKQGYHMEKQYNSYGRPLPFGGQYNAYMSRPYGLPRPPYWSNPNSRPVASVRPIMSNPQLRPNIVGGAANRMLRPGVTVHPVVTTVDVTLPGKNAEGGPNKIPAGQPVLIIKTPKGLYIRTPEGKIFAVKSKGSDKTDGEDGDNADSNKLPELFGFAPITKTMVSSSEATSSSSSLLDSVKQQTAAVTSLLGSANTLGSLHKKIGPRFPSASPTVVHRRPDGRLVVTGNQSGMRKMGPNPIIPINRFQRPGVGPRPRGPVTVRIPQSQLAKYPGLLRLPQVKAVMKAAAATTAKADIKRADGKDEDDEKDSTIKDTLVEEENRKESDGAAMKQSTGTSAMSDDDDFRDDAEPEMKVKAKPSLKKFDWMTADDELPNFSDSSENGMSADEMHFYREGRSFGAEDKPQKKKPEIQPIIVYPKVPIPGLMKSYNTEDPRASNLMPQKIDMVPAATPQMRNLKPRVTLSSNTKNQANGSQATQNESLLKHKNTEDVTKPPSHPPKTMNNTNDEEIGYGSNVTDESKILNENVSVDESAADNPEVTSERANVYHTPSFSDIAPSFVDNQTSNISPQLRDRLPDIHTRKKPMNPVKYGPEVSVNYEQDISRNYPGNRPENYRQGQSEEGAHEVHGNYESNLPGNFDEANFSDKQNISESYDQITQKNNRDHPIPPSYDHERGSSDNYKDKMPQNYESFHENFPNMMPPNMRTQVGSFTPTISQVYRGSQNLPTATNHKMNHAGFPQQPSDATGDVTPVPLSNPTNPKKKPKRSRKKNAVNTEALSGVTMGGFDPYHPNDAPFMRPLPASDEMSQQVSTPLCGPPVPQGGPVTTPKKRERKSTAKPRKPKTKAVDNESQPQTGKGNLDWGDNSAIPQGTAPHELGSTSNTVGSAPHEMGSLLYPRVSAPHAMGEAPKNKTIGPVPQPSPFIPPFSSFAERTSWNHYAATVTTESPLGHVSTSSLDTATTLSSNIPPAMTMPSAFNQPAQQTTLSTQQQKSDSFPPGNLPQHFATTVSSFNSFDSAVPSINFPGQNPSNSTTTAYPMQPKTNSIPANTSIRPANPTTMNIPSTTPNFTPSTFSSYPPTYNPLARSGLPPTAAADYNIPTNSLSYNGQTQYNYNPLSSFSSLLHDPSYSPSSLDPRYSLDNYPNQQDPAPNSASKPTFDSLRQLSNLSYGIGDMSLPYHNPYITFPHSSLSNFSPYSYNNPYNPSFPPSSMFSSPYQQQSGYAQSPYYSGNSYPSFPDANSTFPPPPGNAGGFL